MRPANACTIGRSTGSKPCSRNSAASAASSSAASTFRLCASRCSSSSGKSPPRCVRGSPSGGGREPTAELPRETACERILASRPSLKSGYRSYSSRAIASSSTLSPRNSRRSYDAERSLAHDAWGYTCAARSSGRRSISCASSETSPRGALLVGRDVVDGLADGLNLLGVLVGDLDPELVLELHDQLDEIQRVGVEVLLEGRLLRDLALVDTELLGQDFLYSLEDFLARRCHVTSRGGRGRRRAGL